MGQLYVGAEDIQTSSAITNIGDIDDEFGDKNCSNVPGGQALPLPVTGSYAVMQKIILMTSLIIPML